MHYQENLNSWNQLAKAYKEKFNQLTLYQNTYDFFCTQLKSDQARILDVGCGPATITSYLHEKNKNYHLLGIDNAPNMVTLAKETVPKAEFRVLDSRNVLELNGKFDGIVCGFCLPYIDSNDVKKLLADLFQLLESNGILYLSFVAGEVHQSGFKTGSTGLQTYFYYHPYLWIGDLLKQVGFSPLNSFEVPYTTEIHQVLLMQKQVL